MKMNQSDVEEAFHKLAKKYIKKPLNEYYQEVYKIFDIAFFKIDITKSGWRDALVSGLDKAVKELEGFVFITENEIKDYVKQINCKSIKKNCRRITESVVKKFKDNAACIIVAEKNISMDLADWLCSMQGEEPQNILFDIKKEALN
jgi:hypothetical protein